MNDILSQLSAPFPPEMIEWRVGSTNQDKTRGMALAYIDARLVQDRFNAVCGALWQNDHTVSADGKKVTCRIAVKVDNEWIWRADGAGETDYEAEKGSYSDSFKRAAVKWGVGRYLYDIEPPWVAIEAMGKSFKIKESERERLYAIAAGKAPAATKAPATASPGAPTGIPPAVVEFFKRSSYEIPGGDLLALADKLVKAIGFAWHPDQLLQLEEDNKDHIAALHNQAPASWKDVQTALSAARKRLTVLAA